MRVWKHHIAAHFIDDPSLANDPENGPGTGATVFLCREKMIEILDKTGEPWYVCESLIPIQYLQFNTNCPYLATALRSYGSIEGFKPLEFFK